MPHSAPSHARLAAGVALLTALAAPRLRAQQERQIEAHAVYARETQSHDVSWGGGALYELVWGSEERPVRLGTALGADYQKANNGGPGRTSGALELTLEGGRLGLGPVTPYLGGAVTSNWYSGHDAPRRALAGIEGIIGAAVRLTPRGPLEVKAEFRPGYVHTQEHEQTVHVGLIYVL